MRRLRARNRSKAYNQLYRVVDGAVFDALWNHPDYLTDKGRRNARSSVVKRVTGAVLGYAEQSARGRSGSRPAPERVGDAAASSSRTAGLCAVSKWRAAAAKVVRLFGFGGRP